MKINKISLENYRVHEKLELEFSDGINLLLGSNGRGKSSILEAIGLALFGSKQRAGGLKDIVTFGKKNAKIEINFTGIDGEEYQVIRKLPKTDIKLYRLSDGALIDGKDEKIKELCGISGEITDIYDNIIVAKQNEFVAAFKETPAARERIFNRIFNTDIYLDIYNGHAKYVLDKYDKKLTEKTSSLATLTEHIEDPDVISSNLEEAKVNLGEIKEKYDESTKAENEIKARLTELENLKLEYEKSKAAKNITEKEIENIRGNIAKLEEKLEKTEIAKKICNENQEDYDRYIALQKELGNLKSELKEIEIKKDNYLKSEKEKFELEKINSELAGELTLIASKEENSKKNIEDKKLELENTRSKLATNETLGREYEEKLEVLTPLIASIQKLEADAKDVENRISHETLRIGEKNDKLDSSKNLLLQLEKEEIINKVQEIETLKEKKLELEKQNEIIKSQIRENREAAKMLGNSTCPYLKESCKNLDGKDIDRFFKERIDTLMNQGITNKKEIDNFAKILEDERSLKEKEFRYRQLTKDVEELKFEIEKENLVIEGLKKDGEILAKEYENLRLKHGFKQLEELQEEKIVLAEKLNLLDLETLKQDIENLVEIISDEEEKLEKLEEKKEDISLKTKENSKILQEIANYLEENRDIIEIYRAKNFEIEVGENNLSSLESVKEIYLENLRISREKESITSELEVSDKKVKELEELVISQEKESLEITGKLATYDEEKLSFEERRYNEINRELSSKLGEIRIQIKGFEEKLVQINKQKDKLKEIQKEIDFIKKKLELTAAFRDNIKTLGKEVAKSMLYKIEEVATANFRKITGRGEQVRWSNDDSDKYTVYLVSETKKLNFDQLSGGEQVAVAIAIRSAMSNIFTESKFSIFDEPTNNLDTERRQSLADSIGEILKDLEQAIIVTHDDTFKEMAQKVINL